MVKRNFKSIAASFNLDDKRQKEAYDYIKSQSNSSFYLKSLVLMDMSGNYVADVHKTDTVDVNFKSFL